MNDLVFLKEQIRQRVDLVELVSEHVALRRAGKDFLGLCPFHNERTPSFTVSPSKGIYKCFGCGAGGDVFTFVQSREQIGFAEAMRVLADRAGVDLRAVSPRGRGAGQDRTDLARVNAWAVEAFRQALLEESLGCAAREYITARGLDRAGEVFTLGLAPDNGRWLLERARAARVSESALAAAGLCQTGLDGSSYCVFRGRLMFPIRDTMKRVIGFGGRTLKDDRAKYINTAQNTLFDKGRNLFGIDLARDAFSRTRRAVVVEGYTDCMAAHQCGFSQTVATLGTALTDAQVELLRRWCDEITIVMDSDEAGQAAADRAVGVALRYGVTVRIARVPEGKDPCDYLVRQGAEAFQKVLDGAVDALTFKWERLQRSCAEDQSGARKKDAIREFVSLIGRLARFGTVDAIQQGLIANQLAGLLALPADRVFALLRDAAAARPADGGLRTGADSGDPGLSPPADAEQSALLMILEVLLNQPGYYDQVAGWLHPERFVDRRLGRLAERVGDLCRESGGFELIGLLDGFEDPVDTRIVTDLYYRGQQRGNFEATLDGARQRLDELAVSREARQAADELGRGPQAGDDAAQRDAQWARLHRFLAGAHGFAPQAARTRTGQEPPGQ